MGRPLPTDYGCRQAIKAKAFLIDGEVVACDDTGLAAFERIRHRRNDPNAFLYAFDLLSINSKDNRKEPIERRKAALARLLRPQQSGIRTVEHIQSEEGDVVFAHA